MTVRELIDILHDYPPDLRVVVNGYEDGYDDLTPSQLDVVEIALNVGRNSWEGDHLDKRFPPSRGLDSDTEFGRALVLQRTSH